MLGKVVTAILGIVSIKYVTNYLDTETYGEYTTIYDYAAMFAIIADFGLFTIAVREMAHSPEKNMIQKIVGNVLSIRALLAILSLGLGVAIAMWIPSYRDTHIPWGVLIVSIATIITLVSGTMSSVLQFHLKMQWTSIALIVGKIVTVAYILLSILWLFPTNPSAGFAHLQIAWIFGGIFTLIITYFACNAVIPISFQFDFSFWKSVLIKALPYGLALVLGTIYFRMGTIILSLLKDSDSTGFFKEQVGYYGVPLRFLEILQIVPHFFMNSVLPVLTLRLKDSIQGAAHIIKNCLNALFALALPILIGGYLLAWPITAAVSSPDFLTRRDSLGNLIWGSDIALQILLVGMLLIYLHVALSYTLVAMGRQIELLWINLIAVIINISLNLVLAPRYGFAGTSVSVVITELVMLIALYIRTSKRIHQIWDVSFFAKTIFSGTCMGLVLWLIAEPLNNALYTKSLLILIPVGAIVYGICMLATKAISKEMLQIIRRTETPVQEDVI